MRKALILDNNAPEPVRQWLRPVSKGVYILEDVDMFARQHIIDECSDIVNERNVYERVKTII